MPQNGKLKVSAHFFSNEIYGIGLKRATAKGVAAVNEALRAMFNDGSWRAALSKELPQLPAEAPTIGKFDIPFHQ
jgi:glutamate transport system substrate-binding protein